MRVEKRKFGAVILLISLLGMGWAVAQVSISNDGAQAGVAVAHGGGSLSFSSIYHDGPVSLTVSGGDFWHRDVGESQIPEFDPVDEDGYSLPDGNYHYEARFLAEDGDRLVTAAVQSGSFVIQGGLVTVTAPAQD